MEELADLRQRQRLATLRKEVKEERRNLAALEGSTTGSTFLPTHTERATDRPRSETVSEEEEPPPKRQRRDDDDEGKRKLVDPKEYWGKSLKEYTEFIRTCERNFNTRPRSYRKHRYRVLYAASWLRSDPANDWNLQEEKVGLDNVTWEGFKSALMESLKPEALRKAEYYRKHRQAIQGKHQSAQQFVAHLKILEQHLEPFSEVQRAYNFLNRLRLELKMKINERAENFETRNDVLVIATLIEAALKEDETPREAKATVVSCPRGTVTGNSGLVMGEPCLEIHQTEARVRDTSMARILRRRIASDN